MKTLFFALFISLFCSITLMAQQQSSPTMKEELKEYFFVMLKRGPNRGQSKAAADSIQKGHMAHINKMAERGDLCIAGPFGDDGDWRGILIFKTKSIQETKDLVEDDPAIQSGRLTYEVHPWWSMKGAKLD
jgi:uncharacterized protein